MKTQTISACIITNNNPRVIDAIKSIYNSVSEIILVNTCDEFTINISNYGKIKLFHFDWTNNFSDARNYSISKAKGDYILIIDSDEVMTAEIKYIDPKYDIYLLQIFNRDIPYWNARVFKNNGKILYKNGCHETVEHHITKDNMALIHDCSMIHSGCQLEMNSKELNQKIDRNERIMLKDLDNPVRNYHLGLYAEYKKDYKKAIEYFLNVLNDNVNNEHKANACNFAFRCFKELGTIQQDLLRASLEYFPLQRTARIELIGILNGMLKSSDKNNFEKIKELTLTELNKIKTIESRLNNDVKIDLNFINQKIGEIEKWQSQ